jgi:hypothetical protein
MLERTIIAFLAALLDDDPASSAERVKAARHELERELRKTRANDEALLTLIEALARQNNELRIRVGVLVRLMVERGFITSEEFAAKVQQAKAPPAEAKLKTGTGPSPAGKKLPKPPRKLGPGTTRAVVQKPAEPGKK